ncbi:MAG: ABC transporter permease [Candidatus Hodarchaeota archaeon]
MGFVRVVKAQMTRWVKSEFFRPGNLIWNFVLPLTWGLQFYFLYIPFQFGEIALQLINGLNVHVNLVGYTLSGQVCWMLFVNASIFGGAFFLRERWGGTLEVLFLSPASRIGIVTGTALAGASNFLWFILGLLIAVILLNVQLNVISWFAVVVSLFVSILVLIALGMFFETFFIASRLGGMWATAIQEPMQFLSGLIFPIQYLPKVLQIISTAIPLTYVLLIVRGTLLGSLSLESIALELCFLTLTIFCLIGLCLIFLIRVERHIKRHANLTMF